MKYNYSALGDLCSKVLTGGTPLTSKTEYYDGGTIPWLKTKEVNFSRIHQTEYHITEKGLYNSSAKMVPANSVIVAMYGQGDTAGRVAINKIPITTNQACCNLVIDEDKADYRFVYYALKNSYEQLVSMKNGGAQPNLNTRLIKSLQIPNPPLKVQYIVASILSTYDDLIENNQKQIKLLEEAAMKLYKEWFLKLRFPGYETTKIIYGVPEGWYSRSLKGVIKFIKGKKPGHITDEQIKNYQKLLLIDSMESGQYKYTDPTSQVLAKDGEILMLMDGARSSHTFIAVSGVVGSTLARIEIIDDSVPVSYLKLYFDVHAELFKANNTGSAIPHANRNFIESRECLFPDANTMYLWDKFTYPTFRKIAVLKSQLAELKKARDMLLPKLMSGEIEV